MNRYLISHPLVNAESYFDNSALKVLYIPLNSEPSIIIDQFSAARSFTFGDEVTFSIHLNEYTKLMMADTYQDQHQYINQFATFLYRLHNPSNVTIYGPVLLYGAMNFLTMKNSSTYYSVPHEIFEQVSRLLTTVHT